MSQPTIVEFDLDRYLRNSKKVDLSGIDWEAVPDHVLTDGDVMCLHYMMDIETHTVIYLRDLLASRVAMDPQITAFLSCWVSTRSSGTARRSPTSCAPTALRSRPSQSSPMARRRCPRDPTAGATCA
jgi:hypothetical protein